MSETKKDVGMGLSIVQDLGIGIDLGRSDNVLRQGWRDVMRLCGSLFGSVKVYSSS